MLKKQVNNSGNSDRVYVPLEWIGKKVKEEKVPQEVIKLAQERLKARLNKDWTKVDELLQKIAALGYSVGDTKEGYEVRKV